MLFVLCNYPSWLQEPQLLNLHADACTKDQFNQSVSCLSLQSKRALANGLAASRTLTREAQGEERPISAERDVVVERPPQPARHQCHQAKDQRGKTLIQHLLWDPWGVLKINKTPPLL